MNETSSISALIVNPEKLPARLGEALEKRNVDAEATSHLRLGATLVVLDPDVLIASEKDLEHIQGTLREEEQVLAPIFLIVPRGSISRYRGELPDYVCGIVPLDMPLGAIGARLRTALKKRKAGSGELVRSTLIGGAPPPLTTSPVTPPKLITREKSTPAKRTIGARVATTPGIPHPSDLLPRPETKPLKQTAKLNSPASPAGASPLGKPSQPSPATDSERNKRAHAKTLKLQSPDAATRTPAAQSLKPEPPAPTPRTTRISLQVPAMDLESLRLAVIDDDLTRADAISRALRDAGHEVFLVSNTPERIRFHLLRKFGPHAVVLDEASLGGLGGVWLSAFRSDHHLKATPLVAARFGALFDDDSGATHLEVLSTQLEGLGKTEMQLITQLLPGKEIEVSRAQIPVGRLLHLLSDHGQAVELETVRDGKHLKLPLDKGACAKADLTDEKGKTLETLDPLFALDWLLEGDDALVVRRVNHKKFHALSSISELLESSFKKTPAKSTTSAPRAPALAETATTTLPPSSPEPQTETSPSVQLSSSELEPRSPSAEPIGFDSSSREIDTEPPPRAPLPPQAKSVLPDAGAPLSEDEPTLDLGGHQATIVGVKSAIDDATASSPPPRTNPPSSDQLAARSSSRHTPTNLTAESKIPRGKSSKPFVWAFAATGLLVSGAALTQYLSSDDSTATESGAAAAPRNDERVEADSNHVAADSEPQATGDAEPEPEAKTPENKPEEAPPAPQNDDNLWAVQEDTDIKSCEELLTRSRAELQALPSWQGKGLWKRARKELLVGNHENSHQLMCQAAFVDPGGPASVGLARYYLTHRSLENAKYWAAYGIEHRGKRTRSSEELLGDMHNQSGELEKAKAIWLETMRLNPDDQSKLVRVARSLLLSARKSIRGGDPPLAERLLRRAATFDPKNAEIAATLSTVLTKNAQTNLAEQWATHAETLNPKEGRIHIAWGDIERAAGKTEIARQHYEQVPGNSPAHTDAKRRLKALDG